MGTAEEALSGLLDRALSLPAAERAAFIDALGPEHDALKPRLRKLLALALRTSSSRLTTLPKLGPEPIAPLGLCVRAAGSRVGTFRLVRRLGIGGMGVVWLARDEAADRERLVALKFAHARPDRADLATRLARESDVLASLEHPNIARLYAAELTDDQRLYLVLEYVEGLPFDEYCAERRANLALKLALFVQIADAVTHAHERRIVHRDLKPANVLVTAGGETKLLDFGTAKLLGDDPIAQMQLSRVTGRPLTPEYASPEQVAGEDVGLASDVFSLGVMLYEAATGVRPHAYARGSNRAMREAILERVPVPPSAAARDEVVRRQLEGGLDATILRALRKQASERHASMRELAGEIEQHARRLARAGA